MLVAQVSPNSVMSNPSRINPLAPSSSHTAATQAAQAAQQAVTQTRTDTVTISPQAAQMSTKANGLSDEARENAAERRTEQAKGQQ